MSSTYLEQVRAAFSQIEVIEKTIVFCMQSKQVIPNQAVLLDHRIHNLIQMAQKTAADALILIDGADGWKKEEMNYLQGVGGSGDVWENFYERFKEIKDYHKRVTNVQTMQNKVEFYYEQAFAPPFKEPYFSGEEHHGRFLDMHASYKEFLNLKKLKESNKIKIGDYLWYLQNFQNFHDIPLYIKEKEGSKYKRYLINMLEYLRSFYLRVNPLQDVSKIEQKIDIDFQTQWENGQVKGWEHRKEETEEMRGHPHYCEACQKKFQNENTFVNHFDGKKHKALAKLKEKQIEQVIQASNQQELPKEDNEGQRKRKMAYLEVAILQYKDTLQQQLNDTMNLVRKKQSRRYEENEDEEAVPVQDQQLDQPEEASSEDESPIYNPKNLPLGWDGRPIPYWLYKLHGLGVEYKCEICGNTSYWGRKAFEDHFQGWRHSYGMRCLRIPNTLHFKEITKIQDAISLYKKIQQDQERSKFRPEYEEEYEDTDGNLLNKKTYYDLKKQGLL
ncbi:unnamed protein product [Paramecium octaurelia]|uniref:Matrin-type domain-containing protein n=1 Tax=Paramecium octaurelia TaxID=43137 RepID=A0A8S1XFZ2_PAROT|nr:unnamed protein product [Paramecium octaurelia]